MCQQIDKKMILFSPIGDSDPIRKMHDGACLHIIRHYKPDAVVLFLTEEMEQKEKEQKAYSRPIHQLCPNLPIEYIYTHIKEAHLYDSFMHTISEAVYKIHEQHPEAEIIMNLSSGTPQIKTVMALLSMQEDWCRGVQVISPEHGSNQNAQENEQADIETMMATNLDDEEGMENRCEEPQLRILHYYEDKNRIESLIHQYEYAAALNLAQHNHDIPLDTVRILKHADFRTRLQTQQAQKALARYNGIRLCPFHGAEERLVEYFLTMQIDQRKKNLSNVLTKMIPFLYELLQEYIHINIDFSLENIAVQSGKHQWFVKRNIMKQKDSPFLDFLDIYFMEEGRKPFQDCNLSALLLMLICQFAQQENLAKDKDTHSEMLKQIMQVKGIIKMRNNIAHNILNIEEKDFQLMTKIGSNIMLDAFFKMLCLTYGDEVKSLRNTYDQFNIWISASLQRGTDTK